jgi:PAS domain S-box-containing protein
MGARRVAIVIFVAAGASIATAAWTPRAEDFVLLQTVNASVAITSLTLAAVISERNQKANALLAIAADLETRVADRTAELADANDGLAQAQRLSHLGSFHWNARTDVVRWSDELYRIHGLDPSSDPPSTAEYMQQVHDDDRERVQASFLDAYRSNRELDHEFRVVLPDGTLRWLQAYVAPTRDATGKLIGLEGASQDITARKLAEEAHRKAEEKIASEQQQVQEALRTALDREREATAHLRRLDETKNAILSAVSHELRTPLTAILGFTELLQSPDIRADDEMTDELLQRMDGSAQRLGRLLQDLLDLSRLDHGIMEPRRERRSIRALVESALLDLDLTAHPVTVEHATGTCTVDPTHFERIVHNIVGNAVKYTPPGTAIRVAAYREPGDGVTIAIEDEGPGIPEDKRDVVFEPFARLGEGEYTQGAGVGLALVDRFARMHGGRAWLTERYGGGAAFRVYLPGPPAPSGLPGSPEQPSGGDDTVAA